MDLDGIVYAGGEFVPAARAAVSVFDHGLLYGDGVFEGIRAYGGRVFKLGRHIDRLYESAKAIRLDIPLSRHAMSELVLETCRQNDIEDGYVRLVVTRGAGTLGIDPRSCPRPDVIVIARPAATLYRREAGRGITVVTSALRRLRPDMLSPSIKSLNYLNNVLARIEANDRGADEALMLDSEGFVAEATVDNVFLLNDHALVTPPAATNLRGITRETVLELAADLGIPSGEQRFTLLDVWTAREAFLCGTSAEIVPIASVDGRQIGAGEPGPTTRRIIAAFERAVRSSGTPIARAGSPVAEVRA